MVLGPLCMLGIYAGIAGRYATRSITEEGPINAYGWLGLLSIPGVFALFFTMLCVAASKVRPEATTRYLAKVGLKPTRRTAMVAVLFGGLISAGLSLGIAAAKTVASPAQSLSVNESINLSLFFLPPAICRSDRPLRLPGAHGHGAATRLAAAVPLRRGGAQEKELLVAVSPSGGGGIGGARCWVARFG